MATQNPIVQEGTYPLPEAQMDRILLHVIVDYSGSDSEKKVLRLVRGEEPDSGSKATKNKTISQDVIFKDREEINMIHVSENIEQYIVDIISATRFPGSLSEELDKWIDYVASPRGSLAPEKCGRVDAWLEFLSDSCSPCDFTVAPGNLIEVSGFQHSGKVHISPDQWSKLLKEAKRWIHGHRPS